MPAQAPLPPWLQNAGSRRKRGAGVLDGVRKAAAGAVLLAVGGAAGYLLHQPEPAPAAAAAPAASCPTCPATPMCPDTHRRSGPAPARHADARKPRPATPAALPPLPGTQPMDEDTRTKALRAFAEKKAVELRDCLSEPDRGPPKNVGAALEIDAKGSVDSVQILGTEGTPTAVRTCCSKRLKKWRFPEELLRGDEKLLVNFVL